jgi:hypothetical protein
MFKARGGKISVCNEPSLIPALLTVWGEKVTGSARRHADDCDYHLDQYEFECTCGVNRRV